MSSLRITHSNRGTPAPNASGDAQRAEPPGVSASFAVTLGAAGLASKEPITALLGAKTSDNPSPLASKRAVSAVSLAGPQDDLSPSDGLALSGSLSPRDRLSASNTRVEDRGAADDTTASLATRGSLAAPQDDMSPADGSSPDSLAPLPKRTVGQGRSDGAAAFPAQALLVAASLGATSLADLGARTDGASSKPSVAADAGTTPAAVAKLGAPVTNDAAPTTAPSTNDGTTALLQPAVPRLTALVTGGALTAIQPTGAPRSISPAGRAATVAGQVSPLQLTITSGNPSNDTTVTATPASGVTASKTPGDATVAGPALVHVPALNGLAAEGAASVVPAVAASSDAAGTAATLQPTLASVSSAGETRPTPTLHAGPFLAQILVPAGPGAGNSGGGDRAFDASDRNRFAPIAAAPDAAGSGIVATAVSGSGDTARAASAATTAASSVADPGASGTISDQVATQLVQLVSSGSHDMVMRLHPPELGDLTVRVAISGRDVSAWFTSPQPQVQSAVSDAIGQLQTNLADAGYNLSGAWVGADASGGRQQGSNLPASPPARAPVAVNAVDPPATVGFRPAASGLNVYV
jgi:hypothetical protein